MSSLLIEHFLGGLNVRDAPNQLTIWETPSAHDVVMDEQGSIQTRKGCTQAVSLPGTNNKVAGIHYSKALDLWVCVRESGGVLKLFSRPADLSGSWTDRGQVSTTLTARAAFVDWPGATPYVVVVVANDPETGGGTVGGVYTFNGSSNVVQRSSTVGGACIALWQNRVWVAGFPLNNSDGNRTRIFYSGRGDPTLWNVATQFIDVRAKDAQPITALGVAGGALISFKRESTYRHKDAETGDFDIIDTAVGCVNPRAIVPLRGRLYVWAADGLYACDGVGPLENVGDKLSPWYISSLTTPATIIGGQFEDRVFFYGTIFGIPRIVEYEPEHGYLLYHLLPSSNDDIGSFARKGYVLYAASTDGSNLFEIFTTQDDGDFGASIDAYWESAWLMPSSGMLARLDRVRVQGVVGSPGTVALVINRDWDPALNLGTYDLTAQLTSAAQNAAADVNQPAGTGATGLVGQGYAFKLSFIIGGTGGNVKIRTIQIVDHTLSDRSLRKVGYPSSQIAGRQPVKTGRRGDPQPPPPLPPPAP